MSEWASIPSIPLVIRGERYRCPACGDVTDTMAFGDKRPVLLFGRRVCAPCLTAWVAQHVPEPQPIDDRPVLGRDRAPAPPEARE